MEKERKNGIPPLDMHSATETSFRGSGSNAFYDSPYGSYDSSYNTPCSASGEPSYDPSNTPNRALSGGDPPEDASTAALKRMNAALLTVAGIAVTALFVILIVVLANSNKEKKKTDPGGLLPVADEFSTADVTLGSSEESTAAQPTAAAQPSADGWEAAPADKLYHPPEALIVDQYTAYVCCTDTAVQDYVKMRNGPSKARFDPVGVIIDNFEAVTVESKSLNGWTLCFYRGAEGWIRSDFLFASEAAARAAIGAAPAQPEPTQYAAAGTYRVHVTGDYAGEPLNLRAGPGRENTLIAALPEDTAVTVPENTPVENGWVYVEVSAEGEFGGKTGYVLYQYLEAVQP